MCGIVGIYLKNKDLHSVLGALFCPMLQEMGDRGPDSSGFAIYRENYNNNFKVTLYSPDKSYQWKAIKNLLKKDKIYQLI